MKRFLTKLLIFAIIIAVITVSINYIYTLRDGSDPQNVRKFKKVPSSVKVCNLGSSHGRYDFDYRDVEGLDCFNFALSSQVFSYDERILEYYKDHISPGAVVFIPVSYFSFYGKDERTEEDFLSKNRRYYEILPPKYIKDYDLKTDIYVNYFPSLYAGVSLINTILLGARDNNNEMWSRKAVDIDIMHDAQSACERHIITNKLDENGKRIINQEEFDSLERIIRTCYDMGCTPILVTTPFLSEYTDAVKKSDSDFYSDFYSLIDKVKADTGVEYYDYAFDERFTSNYDLFMNSDHLNIDGAREFVNILMDEVVHYGSDRSLIR